MPHLLDLSIPRHLSMALGPDLWLMAGAMVLMLWASWREDSVAHQRSVAVGSIVVVLTTLAAVLFYWWKGYTSTRGIVAVDNFRWAADVIFLVGTLATLMLSADYNGRERITQGESHVLVLFATAGMMLLAGARDLIMVFLGIELMSVSTYVLAGMNRRSPRSAEAALKYFLLGAFSTGFLLYGIALVYGATGATNLATIGDRIATYELSRQPLLIAGIGLLLVGFGFKVAAAPFHMWAPDVYEGAPTPITGYMAAAVKAAAFAAFLRVFLEAFGHPLTWVHWYLPVWYLAATTMIVGNVIALAQRNIKRILAYSSVSHAGYILVALATGTLAGANAFVFYLFAYTLATMGAFAVVVALGQAGEASMQLDDWSGLWRVRPWTATAMAVFMLALLGFPVFGGVGFFAKWYVLQAALSAPSPLTTLTVILVLTSVISAGYYLYVVMVMFMRPRPVGAVVPGRMGGMTSAVIIGSAALILLLGFTPNLLLQWSRGSGMSVPPPTAAELPPAAVSNR